MSIPAPRLLILASLLAGALSADRTRANGWEHAAIPMPALIKGLSQDDSATRARAADLIGHRGDREALPHLIAALERPERVSGVRGAIYVALGEIGGDEARTALLACLRVESNPAVHARCVRGLGELGGREALDALLEILDGDERWIEVQQATVMALGRFDEAQAVERLAELTRLPGNIREKRVLKRLAIRALGETGSALAERPLLAVLESDASEAYSSAALSALTQTPSIESREILVPLIEGVGNDFDRRLAVVAYAIGTKGEVASALERLLSDSSPEVVRAAIQGLRDRDAGESAPRIVALAERVLGDLEAGRADTPNRYVSSTRLLTHAVEALTELDPASAMPVFARSASVRPKVGENIGARDPKTLAMMHAASHLRRAALHGLGYVRNFDAADILRGPNGVGERDPRLRAVAARSLAVLGAPAAAATLIELLDDRSAEVVWTAAAALGALGERSAVPKLIEKLAHVDSRVRREAAAALGYLKAESARAALEKALKDRDPEVARIAGLALALLDD